MATTGGRVRRQRNKPGGALLWLWLLLVALALVILAYLVDRIVTQDDGFDVESAESAPTAVADSMAGTSAQPCKGQISEVGVTRG